MPVTIESLEKQVRKKNASMSFAWLADLLIEDNRLDEARGYLEIGLAHHPEHIMGLLVKAKLLIRQESYDNALACLNDVLNQDPMNLGALRFKVLACQQLKLKKDLRLAAQGLHELDLLAPDLPSVPDTLDEGVMLGNLDMTHLSGQNSFTKLPEDIGDLRIEQEALFESLEEVFLDDSHSDLDDKSTQDLSLDLDAALNSTEEQPSEPDVFPTEEEAAQGHDVELAISNFFGQEGELDEEKTEESSSFFQEDSSFAIQDSAEKPKEKVTSEDISGAFDQYFGGDDEAWIEKNTEAASEHNPSEESQPLIFGFDDQFESEENQENPPPQMDLDVPEELPVVDPQFQGSANLASALDDLFGEDELPEEPDFLTDVDTRANASADIPLQELEPLNESELNSVEADNSLESDSASDSVFALDEESSASESLTESSEDLGESTLFTLDESTEDSVSDSLSPLESDSASDSVFALDEESSASESLTESSEDLGGSTLFTLDESTEDSVSDSLSPLESDSASDSVFALDEESSALESLPENTDNFSDPSDKAESSVSDSLDSLEVQFSSDSAFASDAELPAAEPFAESADDLGESTLFTLDDSVENSASEDSLNSLESDSALDHVFDLDDGSADLQALSDISQGLGESSLSSSDKSDHAESSTADPLASLESEFGSESVFDLDEGVLDLDKLSDTLNMPEETSSSDHAESSVSDSLDSLESEFSSESVFDLDEGVLDLDKLSDTLGVSEDSSVLTSEEPVENSDSDVVGDPASEFSSESMVDLDKDLSGQNDFTQEEHASSPSQNQNFSDSTLFDFSGSQQKETAGFDSLFGGSKEPLESDIETPEEDSLPQESENFSRELSHGVAGALDDMFPDDSLEEEPSSESDFSEKQDLQIQEDQEEEEFVDLSEDVGGALGSMLGDDEGFDDDALRQQDSLPVVDIEAETTDYDHQESENFSDDSLSGGVANALDNLFGGETTEDLSGLMLEGEEDSQENDAEDPSGSTRTLAEIYFNQRFYHEALKMYQDLQSRDPSDASVNARIEEIQQIIEQDDQELSS